MEWRIDPTPSNAAAVNERMACFSLPPVSRPGAMQPFGLVTCTPKLGHPAGGFSGFMDVADFAPSRGS